MTARTPRAISNDAFHQIKADYPERSFARALKEGKITERDVTLIRSSIAELQSHCYTRMWVRISSGPA